MTDTTNKLMQMRNGEQCVKEPSDYRGRNILQQFRGYLTSMHGTRKTLGITSCEPSAGVISTVVKVAVTAAQTSSSNVVAIDTLSGKGRLSEQLGASAAIETGDLQEVDWPDSVLLRTSWPNLRVFQAGTEGNGVGIGMDSLAMGALLEELQEENDFVVAALPPLDENTPTALLAQLFEAVVLVVHGGKTRKSAIQRAIGQLDQYGVNLLGAVFFDRGSSGR